MDGIREVKDFYSIKMIGTFRWRQKKNVFKIVFIKPSVLLKKKNPDASTIENQFGKPT